jgi:phenylpyruvate tautomerase PptA (4-oxalocrotonate tautomerase family)
MPYINLKVAGPLSAEQKKEIAKQFTHWAVGEKLLSEK